MHTHCAVPGVGSQTLRRVWTQTGDGHDADAQVQTLIGRPGLLPLCNGGRKKTFTVNQFYDTALISCFLLKTRHFRSHLTLGPGPGPWWREEESLFSLFCSK